MLRNLIQFGWLVGGYATLALAARILPVVFRRVHALRARRRTRRSAPMLWFSLLVRIADADGSIHPSVQLRGEGLRADGVVRLELIDEREQIRFSSSQDLPASAVGSELPLLSFFPPAGATPDDVLRWRWDLVVEAKGRRPAASSHHLVPAG